MVVLLELLLKIDEACWGYKKGLFITLALPSMGLFTIGIVVICYFSTVSWAFNLLVSSVGLFTTGAAPNVDANKPLGG